MRAWPVQDAKARFSEMLETCLKDGPQLVTKRGADAAVLVPVEEWEKLKRFQRPTLREILLASASKNELEIPKRGAWTKRAPPALE